MKMTINIQMKLSSAMWIHKVFSKPLYNQMANGFGKCAKIFNASYQTGKTRQIAYETINARELELRLWDISFAYHIPTNEAETLAKFEKEKSLFLTRKIIIGEEVNRQYIGKWEAGDCPGGRLMMSAPKDDESWSIDKMPAILTIPNIRSLVKMNKDIIHGLPVFGEKCGAFIGVNLTKRSVERFYEIFISNTVDYRLRHYLNVLSKEQIISKLY